MGHRAVNFPSPQPQSQCFSCSILLACLSVSFPLHQCPSTSSCIGAEGEGHQMSLPSATNSNNMFSGRVGGRKAAVSVQSMHRGSGAQGNAQRLNHSRPEVSLSHKLEVLLFFYQLLPQEPFHLSLGLSITYPGIFMPNTLPSFQIQELWKG